MLAQVLLLAALWVGHACIWTFLLNNLYGRRIPKFLLKPWRLFTGLVILAGWPFLGWVMESERHSITEARDAGSAILAGYAAFCGLIGLIGFPAVTILRLLRRQPRALQNASTRTLDFGAEPGAQFRGNGNYCWLGRLPGNGIFRVDFTELQLALPRLPDAWQGLTVLLMSDFHFHGTPSRDWFERILNELAESPVPDIVAIPGDFVDSDAHRDWIAPILGRLKWTECAVAVLGNHDDHHGPDRIRQELANLGFRVLSNRVDTIAIRGVPCEFIGHEGPWFQPAPRLVPSSDTFRVCLSHSPDRFYWAQSHGVDLMVCGHVHGGQIRLPVIGSIFVPSIYSRRFDMGVFEQNGTVMVVGRGLSGKEPIRIRCNPQVIRITLKRRPPGVVG